MKQRAYGVALLLAAATVGFFVGHGELRPGSWRSVEIDELPLERRAAPSGLELPPLPDGAVRNVLLLIGDGMGANQVEAARWAAFGAEGRFLFERFPVVGLTSTAAVGAPVTDSAAAATAIATGVAARSGAIGVDANGRPLRTILEAARDAGFVTGLVTTAEIWDATPAAFAAHSPRRGDRKSIVAQLAASRVDLLIGGGREQFGAGAGGDLESAARARGITVVGVNELAVPRSLPLWALFPGRLDLPGLDPPLSDWTERAVRLVAERGAKSGTGFFLVIEEEGIDTAAHRNDFAAMMRAALRFDAAVGVAARFAVEDRHTLLLVLGDHATGGPALDHTTTPDRLRVAWTSSRHTGEPVPLYAYGPAGATARFDGAYPQREVARRLAELLGLDLSANWK